MAYSEDHSPWLVWREWFVNHYSAACKVRNTWGMQITCHQTDSYAAKSEKLQLLLFQIGFFFFNYCWRACHRSCFLPFFSPWFDSMCLFLLSFIRTTSSTALVTSQSGILGVHRKGNMRLRLLIDVNLNRQTDVWRVSNLPCQGYFIMLAKASNQSKTLPSPCYISHIDNQRVGSGSGPVGDEEVSLLWKQMWYWGVQVPPSLWFLWALNSKLGLQIMAATPYNQSSPWALSGPACENGFTWRCSFRSAQSQPESMQR